VAPARPLRAGRRDRVWLSTLRDIRSRRRLHGRLEHTDVVLHAVAVTSARDRSVLGDSILGSKPDPVPPPRVSPSLAGVHQ